MAGQFINAGGLDRTIRVVLGLAMLAGGWMGIAGDIWDVALKLFGWVPLLEGIVGWSPFYALLGVSTRRRDC